MALLCSEQKTKLRFIIIMMVCTGCQQAQNLGIRLSGVTLFGSGCKHLFQRRHE